MKRIEIYKKMLRILKASKAKKYIKGDEIYVLFTTSDLHRKLSGNFEFYGLCALYRKMNRESVYEFVVDAKKVLGDKARAGNYWFNTTDAEKAKQERIEFLNKLIKNFSNGKEY